MSSSSRLYADSDSSRVELPVFVTPAELFFTSNKRRLLLTVFNPYGNEAQFRIMTTSPDRFDVSLTKGTIKPNRRIDITIRLLGHKIDELPIPTEDLQTIDYFRVTLQVGPLKGNKPIKVHWCLNAESLDSDDVPLLGSDSEKSLKSSYKIKSSKPTSTTPSVQINQPNISSTPTIHLNQRSFQNQRPPIIRSGRQPSQANHPGGSNVNLVHPTEPDMSSPQQQNPNSFNHQEPAIATGSLQTSDTPQVFIDHSNDNHRFDLDSEMNTTRELVQENRGPSTVTTNGPIRVPGTYPPEWLPDHETDSCMACDTSFTLIKRRHHCRSCGKIFCGECCRQKVKLLYLDNKEARVCTNCYTLIQYTLTTEANPTTSIENSITDNTQQPATSSSPNANPLQVTNHIHNVQRVQGVLKTTSSNNQNSINNQLDCNTTTSSSSSTDQQLNKQVIFADGIRPGTDLSESFPYPIPSSSSSNDHPSAASFSLLTRQNRNSDASCSSNQRSSSKKNRSISKSHSSSLRNITVCDELGYLPPIVISKNSSISDNWNDEPEASNSSSSLATIIANQFRSPSGKKTIQASMESRNCPLNGVVKFEELSSLAGVDDIITFLLLKDYYLKVKLIQKTCCIDKKYVKDIAITDELKQKTTQDWNQDVETVNDILASSSLYQESEQVEKENNSTPQYWCFTSDGLARFGQSEIVLVLDKDKNDSCVPRDVFKVYLTLHELALRRQSLESLGNLLFQDGLFGNRDTAGLLFVRPVEDHCLDNLIIPANRTYLFALVLQRWEVPWSKVFPMRLLLRLGHQFNTYPYPIISFRAREPVYYEVGHTIISILGDFRNFRYSITHVDGMKVMVDKDTRKVLVQLHQSCYQQFNKVLDNSNNEHVLAWSCCPVPESDGHLVSVQNEDGQYETVEFFKEGAAEKTLSDSSEPKKVLGASFIIFSGALKVNQSGQSAKISIVEDGLLIQIQSCTMSALRNAIHFMHHFDIDCENNQDPLNRVEIDWQFEST